MYMVDVFVFASSPLTSSARAFCDCLLGRCSGCHGRGKSKSGFQSVPCSALSIPLLQFNQPFRQVHLSAGEELVLVVIPAGRSVWLAFSTPWLVSGANISISSVKTPRIGQLNPGATNNSLGSKPLSYRHEPSFLPFLCKPSR